jgi:LysM repeat protein
MYGDGKYHGVIAEANPRVDSNSLRPFQRLVVPPLPQKHRRKPVEPEPVGGFIGGGRTYVVQKGDAGFWGVSVKVYGHGKYYKVIAKANPGVNSESLSPGQRLIVPPKPADPSRRVVNDTRGVTPDVPAGYKVYTVRRGDAGFWDVAVKMYGNGRHFGLVARANPGVDSRRLQPGQKLRIPPLGEVRRLTSAATAPIIDEGPGEITPAGADPRPIFE